MNAGAFDGEWWIEEGINFLKGVEGDDLNPLIVSDDAIVEFLRTVPEARESFNRIVPTLLPEERLRLETLATTRAVHLMPDPLAQNQAFMTRMNSFVYRAGPNKGGS